MCKPQSPGAPENLDIEPEAILLLSVSQPAPNGRGRNGDCSPPFAVGTRTTPRPRHKTGVRNYRTGLPPWMFDGKSILRPGVKDLLVD